MIVNDKNNEQRQEVKTAFNNAINEGRLSRIKGAKNYARSFMYMGRHNGIDLFKNINTREYIAPITEAQRVKNEGRY